MAVNIKVLKEVKKHFTNGTPYTARFNDLQHHRNPSGLHNKVKWILKEMDWDLNNLDKVWDKVVFIDKESWETAFNLAIYLLKPKHLKHWCVVVANKYLNRPWFQKLVDDEAKNDATGI